MKVGPDFAPVAALLGDPARANMLTALIGGAALTAGELAREAGVTPQTASSHLAKLQAGGLVASRRQGRHSYFALSDGDVAEVLEGLMSLAARTGHRRTRPGPREPALRQSRVCYDHLAGDLGAGLLDSLVATGRIRRSGEDLALTPAGAAFMAGLSVDVEALRRSRRPLCKGCLDWSARRDHLAGALGAALLDRIFILGWAARAEGSRVVNFSRAGRDAFDRTFALPSPA